MGAGGIVNDQVRALLPAVNHPSIYGNLCDKTREAVEAVNLKGYGNYTSDDLVTIVSAIDEGCGCS